MNKYFALTVLLGVSIVSKSQSLKEAIRLNDNEQQEAASAIYQELMMKEPTNGTNYYYYGENLIDAEKTDSAKIIFEKGKLIDPTNSLNIIGLGELKLIQNDLVGAKTLIDNALQLANNKRADVLMEAAEAYIRYKTKDLITAQVLLDQAVKLEPKNPEVYNLIGDVYSEQNNGSLAAINYNKSLELDKNQVKALLHKGQLYKRATNYDGAMEEFQNAIKIDPNFAPAYREMGEINFKQKKLDLAKENYKKYLALSKNNTNARLRYSYFLFESNNFKEASDELNLINKVDSSNLAMMRIMSYINFEAGKNDSALRTISKVFEITNKDTLRRFARDYTYYGKILTKSGNDSLGIQYMRMALVVDPSKTELYDDLADLFNKSKKFDLAAQAYNDKITNSTKASITDYFNLGRAWYSAKEYQKADSAFIKVNELNPSWPNGYFWRGRSNGQLDLEAKNGLATQHYQKYVELAEADTINAPKYKNNLIEANSYLAFAAYVKKDCKLSISFWNKVLVLDPTNKQAKESIESIKNSKDCK